MAENLGSNLTTDGVRPDPFSVEEFKKWQAKTATQPITLPRKTRKRVPKFEWFALHYDEEMKLAQRTNNALNAVRAELCRLRFIAWVEEKERPIEFGNSVLKTYGFSRHQKNHALQILANAGWISVEWRVRAAPLVTILKGFHFGDSKGC